MVGTEMDVKHVICWTLVLGFCQGQSNDMTALTATVQEMKQEITALKAAMVSGLSTVCPLVTSHSKYSIKQLSTISINTQALIFKLRILKYLQSVCVFDVVVESWIITLLSS
jgi:hypothetical protein